MKKVLFFLIVSLISFSFPIISFAKMVNLYDQPSSNAKVVENIDSSSELIPIITNKSGDWMKVGDPNNGNVGWIKVSDMGSPNGAGMSFTQKTISTSKGPRTLQTIQFATPKELTPAESQDILKKAQLRQMEIQTYYQKMMQQMSQQMDNFYKQNPTLFDMQNVPVLMPIIVMPVSTPPTSTATVPAKKPHSPTPKKAPTP